MFSQFFIDRPKFAFVVSIFISIAGLLAFSSLPVSLYPQITPPEIQISAVFPGASAEVVAQTIGIPIEEGVNGVDDMLYLSSSSSDGRYTATITFNIGVDPDDAQIRVQNRIQQVMARLPEETTRQGISVLKRSSDILGFFALVSPGGMHSVLELNDYAEDVIKKALLKINGTGELMVYGSKSSMRVWLNNDKIAALNIPISTIRAAIQSQNRQPSLGQVGGLPNDGTELMVFPLKTHGRLNDVEDFQDIIIRSAEQGGLVRLRDIATVEIGQENYATAVQFEGAPTAVFIVNLASGANAIDTMNQIKDELERLSRFFPNDMEYKIHYDSTLYISASIYEVTFNLLLTFALVVLVCYVFLQNLRLTLIPSLTILVSLLGTFAVMLAFGYSINMFTLFGLLLAITVVVDDAIIVVERVTHLIDSKKMAAKEASSLAMKEVSGALIATTLVLWAIFIPMAFLGGITGNIYKQFAITISAAISLSTLNALTLSPALCSLMLKSNDKAPEGFFKHFNRALSGSSTWYASLVRSFSRKTAVIAFVFLGLVSFSTIMFNTTPSSFIPNEDQGMILLNIQLPEGASSVRTNAFLDRVIPIVNQEKGVRSALYVAGASMFSGNGENVGLGVIVLDPWHERTTPELFSTNILNRLTMKLNLLPEAQVQLIEMPPIPGLGLSAGVDIRLQSINDADYRRLDEVAQSFIGTLIKDPAFIYAFTGFTARTPNIYMHLNRSKAEAMNIPVSNIFSTIENYLGSGYVNDVNFGTRVNRVIVQSDWRYRRNLESLNKLYVPNINGEKVPLSVLIDLSTVLSPRTVTRYNQYPSAAVMAIPTSGITSGQAMERIEQIASVSLPQGYAYEWSGQSYQERKTEDQMAYMFMLAILFAYLFLVAQYESWSIPVSVMMSVFAAVFGAFVGLHIMDISLSIYTQLGIVLLVGLAAKNSILILEFAKKEQDSGVSTIDAAIKGLNERFRAVLMTASTFVFGIMPMIFATGAGAASRKAVGVPVFYGMLIGTFIGLFVIPLFYILVQNAVHNVKQLKR